MWLALPSQFWKTYSNQTDDIWGSGTTANVLVLLLLRNFPNILEPLTLLLRHVTQRGTSSSRFFLLFLLCSAFDTQASLQPCAGLWQMNGSAEVLQVHPQRFRGVSKVLPLFSGKVCGSGKSFCWVILVFKILVEWEKKKLLWWKRCCCYLHATMLRPPCVPVARPPHLDMTVLLSDHV